MTLDLERRLVSEWGRKGEEKGLAEKRVLVLLQGLSPWTALLGVPRSKGEAWVTLGKKAPRATRSRKWESLNAGWLDSSL